MEMELIEHLFNQAEKQIWEQAEEVMLVLYWELGYQLKDLKEEELLKLSLELGERFGVEAQLFELAYHFYKNNPIKSKAVAR